MERRDYKNFDIKIEKGDENYTARVLFSPAGEASVNFKLPLSAVEFENLILKIGHARGRSRRIESPEMEAARQLGGKLFDSIFTGGVFTCFKESLDEVLRSDQAGLRMRLRLQDVPELADLPWEFLYNTSSDIFVSQSTTTPVIRYIEMPEIIKPLTVNFPLNVLVMISSPSDYAYLNVAQEKANFQKALEPLIKSNNISIEYLADASLNALQRLLRSGNYHVFHFIGHGGFDRGAEQGVLVLEDDNRRGQLTNAQRIGQLLYDHKCLRLVVLNACEGARNSKTDPFAGVAATLVRQGIPAVVAMQFEISDNAAITFSKEFYTALAEGLPVDAGMAEARKAIYVEPNDVEWGTPVLYMRSADGILFNISEIPPVVTPWWKKAYVRNSVVAALICALLLYFSKAVIMPLLDGSYFRKPEGPVITVAQQDYEKGKNYYYNKNYTEAEEWLGKAAEQGNADAQYILGLMFYNAQGVPNDDRKALEWFQKAAKQGYVPAQIDLGSMYADGRGVDHPSDTDAVYWYREAAKRNDPRAQEYLRSRGLSW